MRACPCNTLSYYDVHMLHKKLQKTSILPSEGPCFVILIAPQLHRRMTEHDEGKATRNITFRFIILTPMHFVLILTYILDQFLGARSIQKPMNSIGIKIKYNAWEKNIRNWGKLKFSSSMINKITRVNQSLYLNIN